MAFASTCSGTSPSPLPRPEKLVPNIRDVIADMIEMMEKLDDEDAA